MKKILGIILWGILIPVIAYFALADAPFYLLALVFACFCLYKGEKWRTVFFGKVKKLIFSQKRWLTFSACVFMMLVVTEAYLRHMGVKKSHSEEDGGTYFSPYDDYEENNNWFHTRKPSKTKTWVHPYVTNSLGFYDREWVVERSDSLRVQCFGTSDYYRFLKRDTLDVFNCCITNNDLLFEAKAFEYQLLRYHPDVAVFEINASDVDFVCIRGGKERFLKNGTIKYRNAPWYEFFFKHSRFIRCIVLDVLHQDTHFLSPKTREAYRKEAFTVLEQTMDSIEVIAGQHNVRSIFLVTAQNWELQNKESILSPILLYGKGKHYPMIDMCGYLLNHGITDPANYFTANDPRYFNDNGNKMVARAVLEQLER